MSHNIDDFPSWAKSLNIDTTSEVLRPDLIWNTCSLSPCSHSSVQPTFDPALARDKSSREVRQLWPRFMGSCPDCGELVILYASMEHYLAGDW